MAELVIEVERRSSTGKGANRKLRQQGLIPAIVYGGGKDKESVPVVIDRHAVTELLKQEKGRNTVFLLKMKGTKQERHAMVRDAQIDPITRQYVHLDFIRVMKGQRLKVEVPIVLEGEAEGVKVGGFLDWVGRSLHVECPAEEIPQAFHVDISNLQLSQHLTAADIALPGERQAGGRPPQGDRHDRRPPREARGGGQARRGGRCRSHARRSPSPRSSSAARPFRRRARKPSSIGGFGSWTSRRSSGWATPARSTRSRVTTWASWWWTRWRGAGASPAGAAATAPRSRAAPAAGPTLLVKPQTFMNLSGDALALFRPARSSRPGQCLVVVDDVDMPLGQLRLRERGGPGTHNGLRSIVDAIGEDFPRLRLGICGEHPWDDLAEYVLAPFETEEREAVSAMVKRAADCIEAALRLGIARARHPVQPARRHGALRARLSVRNACLRDQRDEPWR